MGIENGIWLTSSEVYSMRQEIAKVPTLVGGEVKRLEGAICRLADENRQILLWRKEVETGGVNTLLPGSAIEYPAESLQAIPRTESLQRQIDQAVGAAMEKWKSEQAGSSETQSREVMVLKTRMELMESRNRDLSNEIKVLQQEIGGLKGTNEELKRDRERSGRKTPDRTPHPQAGKLYAASDCGNTVFNGKGLQHRWNAPPGGQRHQHNVH
jgi:hypothetical protein